MSDCETQVHLAGVSMDQCSCVSLLMTRVQCHGLVVQCTVLLLHATQALKLKDGTLKKIYTRTLKCSALHISLPQNAHIKILESIDT